jgi:transcriptional regulator with XRE-family HTH domain
MARAIRDGRRAIGWSQDLLATRAHLSQTLVWMAENQQPGVAIGSLFEVCSALDVAIDVTFRLPFAVGRTRQRDAAHARCVAYVQRRLEAAGYRVAREVEVRAGRSHGWIDVLAWHPITGEVLVVEVKTVLDDIGAVERQAAWYEREAWAAAQRLRWRPGDIVTWLLVLATQANDAIIQENRDAFRQSFPVRRPVTTGNSAMVPDSSERRALAMIDPRSRRRHWLIGTAVDGRRSPAPYRDYADFIRAIGSARRRAA